MFWTTFLLDLMLGFATWGGATWCEPFDHPLAHLEADCVSPVVRQGADGLVRVGYEFTPATPAVPPACAPVCPGPAGFCPCPATGCAMPCLPAAGPVTAVLPVRTDRYDVQVKLPAERFTAQMKVGEEAPAMVPVTCVTRGDVKPAGFLTATVSPAGTNRARVELRWNRAGMAKKPGTPLACAQTVNLDTVTGVVLHGEDPEPCCAEVTVRKVKPAQVRAQGFAPPMPAPPPMIPPVPYAGQPAYPVGPVCTLPCPAPRLPQRATDILPEPTPVAIPIPAPVESPVVRPVSAFAVTAVPAKRIRSSHVCLVRDGEKSRLQISREGMSSTCVRLTLTAGEMGAVKLAAGKKYVHVTGKNWKAAADRIEVCDDGTVLFAGHVKLVSEKAGLKASVKADRLCIDVRRGTVEKIITAEKK